MKVWILSKANGTQIIRCFRILNPSDLRKLILVTFLQVGLAFLDLLGVASVGMLGALTIRGIKSEAPGDRVNSILQIIGIENFAFMAQAALIGIFAAVILIIRTVLSIIFLRKIYYFLSVRSAQISKSLISKLFSQPLIMIQSRSTQETIFSLTTGITTITLGVIGTAISITSEIALLCVMSIGLIIVQPLMAFCTILGFGFVGIFVYKLLSGKARSLGDESSVLSIKSDEKISEVISSYREALVRDRREFYAKEIGDIRHKLSKSLAELQFLPNISKYAIEIALVLGALILAAIQFALADATQAIAILSIFLAAGSRIAPALMRVQQGAIQIKSSLGIASPALKLIEELEGVEELIFIEKGLDLTYPGFNGEIEVNNVSMQYDTNLGFRLDNIDLSIKKGEFIAIVGPSGSGKTTLVDILLGIIQPKSGEVLISGMKPLDAISRWPGAIGYVPQNVAIFNSSMRQNIGLGYPLTSIREDYVDSAIRIAELNDFVEKAPDGLSTNVGERGTNLSGGQRQRIGIARALYTKPLMLILDEATSSLDSQAEKNISDSILAFKGEITLIVIAHRLSTVQAADRVIYLNNGSIDHIGTFAEVRNAVTNFDEQAKLMGL